MPHRSLKNWLRLDCKAKLFGVDRKPLTADQTELARLGAKNAQF